MNGLLTSHLEVSHILHRDPARLSVYMCRVALPAQRRLRVVSVTRPTQYLLLDHDVVIAAHAFEVGQEGLGVATRHIVDPIHMILLHLVLFHLIVQLYLLLEHFVLLLVAHFAKTLIRRLTLAQIYRLHME